MATINRKQLGHKRKKGSSKPSYKEYQKYYQNAEWRGNRDYYLSTHPLCECCMSHGRVTAATCVHHKVPFSRGIDEEHKIRLLVNPENFMSLCRTCHTGLHTKDQRSHQEVLDRLTQEEYELIHQLKWMK